MKSPVKHVQRRPSETLTAGAGVVAALLVGRGIDPAIAAWIALGVSALPSVISPIVDWWKARPTP